MFIQDHEKGAAIATIEVDHPTKLAHQFSTAIWKSPFWHFCCKI
jgi:hypothetical protein